MKAIFFTTVLLSACAGPHIASNELSPRKQKQRIALLQKKLDVAQEDSEKAHRHVSQLEGELRAAKLSLIRKQLGEYEKKQRPLEASSLFAKERELLHELIQGGSASLAREAQDLLDRILRLITELSDDR